MMTFENLKAVLNERRALVSRYSPNKQGLTPFENEELQAELTGAVIQPAECKEALRLLINDGLALCLNLGAGSKVRKEHGWLNMDARPLVGIHLCCDMLDLPQWVPANMVSEIYNSDVIEHFTWKVVPDLLQMWFRLLRPDGGKLEIFTPSLRKAFSRYIDKDDPDCNWVWFMYHVFGLQTYDYNIHKCLFDFKTLATRMQAEGFSIQHLPDRGNHLHIIGSK